MSHPTNRRPAPLRVINVQLLPENEQPIRQAPSWSMNYTWKINQFGLHPCEPGQGLNSTIFIKGVEVQEPKWQLQVFPSGSDDDNSRFISIFLTLVNNNGRVVRGNWKCTIKHDDNNEEASDYSKELEFQSLREGEKSRMVDFIERETLFDVNRGLLSNGSITIFCEINLFPDSLINPEERKCFRCPNIDLAPVIACDECGYFATTQTFSTSNGQAPIEPGINSERFSGNFFDFFDKFNAKDTEFTTALNNLIDLHSSMQQGLKDLVDELTSLAEEQSALRGQAESVLYAGLSLIIALLGILYYVYLM